MTQPSRPVIAVLGAAGTEGGGTARALLSGGRFAVRAIVRRLDASVAALARAGAAIVRADLDDACSLRTAFSGAHGVFATTDRDQAPERELAQAGNIADAARDARVAHLVWSTFEDTRRWVPLDDDRMPTLGGRWKVRHFDAKGEADLRLRESGVPLSLLLTSFRWDDLIDRGMQPKRDARGELFFTLPMGQRALPGIAADDIGPCAAAVFERGGSLIGRSIGIAGEHLCGAEMAAKLSRALGEPVRHHSPAFGEYAAYRVPGAPDLANAFHFQHDFNDEYRASRPVDATRALHPALLDFDSWLARRAHELPDIKPPRSLRSLPPEGALAAARQSRIRARPWLAGLIRRESRAARWTN